MYMELSTGCTSPLSHSVAGVSAGGSWATLAPPTAIAPIASYHVRFLSWDASTTPRAVLVVAVFTSPFTGAHRTLLPLCPALSYGAKPPPPRSFLPTKVTFLTLGCASSLR